MVLFFFFFFLTTWSLPTTLLASYFWTSLKKKFYLVSAILIWRFSLILLGRMDSKPRQRGGGRHVSFIRSVVLSLVPSKIARYSENHKKNHGDSAGGGKPFKFCMYHFYYLGRKPLKLC